MRLTEDFPRNSRGMIDFFRKFYEVLSFTAAIRSRALVVVEIFWMIFQY